MAKCIALDTEPTRLTNVEEGINPTDGVNVGQLVKYTNPQWGIFYCEGDFRSVIGSGAIENLVSLYDSPINRTNLKTAKRHQITMTESGIYQLNCRATFFTENSATGTMQIKVNNDVVGEGHTFSIVKGDLLTLEMGQLVYAGAGDYISVCLNIKTISGKLNYEAGNKTMISLYKVANFNI